MANVKEIENYLDDLDNLMDTGWFDEENTEESFKDYTFYHRDITFYEFISKGREIIRQHYVNLKNKQ